VFGTRSIDLVGALNLALEIPVAFRGCKFVIYIDNTSVPEEWVGRLEANGATVIPYHPPSMQEEGWRLVPETYRVIRFLAADLPDWDYLIVRDLDSVVISREVAAVEEWLASDLPFHIMRDHPAHNTAILAGMWGVKREGLDRLPFKFSDRLKEYLLRSGQSKVTDQAFLKDELFPHIRHMAMTHCSYYCTGDMWKTNVSWGYPTKRYGATFVATFRNEAGDPVEGDTVHLRDTPMECRRNRDWRYG